MVRSKKAISVSWFCVCVTLISFCLLRRNNSVFRLLVLGHADKERKQRPVDMCCWSEPLHHSATCQWEGIQCVKCSFVWTRHTRRKILSYQLIWTWAHVKYAETSMLATSAIHLWKYFFWIEAMMERMDQKCPVKTMPPCLILKHICSLWLVVEGTRGV